MLLWMVAKSCIFQDSYWSHWDKKTGISYAVSGNGGYPNSIAEWFTHKKSYWLVQYPTWCVLKSWGIPRSPWVSILSMLMVIWCPIVHFFLLGQEVQVRLRLCIPESARLFFSISFGVLSGTMLYPNHYSTTISHDISWYFTISLTWMTLRSFKKAVYTRSHFNSLILMTLWQTSKKTMEKHVF